jgi:hypothetical protein
MIDAIINMRKFAHIFDEFCYFCIFLCSILSHVEDEGLWYVYLGNVPGHGKARPSPRGGV